MILNYGNKLVSPVMLVAPLMRNDTPLSNNFIKIIKSSPKICCICILYLCFMFVFRILYREITLHCVKVVESSAESSLPTTL